MRAIALVGVILSIPVCASAQEHNRIRRAAPTAAEQERIASEMALNDGLLQRGDIVATDRGFVVFRGLAPDGISNDFAPISNPLAKGVEAAPNRGQRRGH